LKLQFDLVRHRDEVVEHKHVIVVGRGQMRRVGERRRIAGREHGEQGRALFNRGLNPATVVAPVPPALTATGLLSTVETLPVVPGMLAAPPVIVARSTTFPRHST
jgi:hypothetical protein